MKRAMLLLACSGFAQASAEASRAGQTLVGRPPNAPAAPRARGAAEQAGTFNSHVGYQWADGKVNYFIDTAGSDPKHPTSATLSSNDDRIVNAIRHWEDKTCVRFTRCSSEARCAKPYMRFRAAAEGCNSPVGVSWETRVNDIHLAANCDRGSAIHEIGHSLGLAHEQARNDRDEYVEVMFNRLASDKHFAFNKAGVYGRDLYEYDYDSIMHYRENAFADGRGDTIRRPAGVRIGRKQALSKRDIAAIDFMYNSCRWTSARAPRCVSNRERPGEAAETIVIPYGKAFGVEFNAVYHTQMEVSYSGTTARSSAMDYAVASGATLEEVGVARTTFTPTARDAGKTFTIAAAFKEKGGWRSGTTCAVTVKVAAAKKVCFGLASTDANVCSGNGVCTSDAVEPCRCHPGFSGRSCQYGDDFDIVVVGAEPAATPKPKPTPVPAPKCARALRRWNKCDAAEDCCGAGLACRQYHSWGFYCQA